MTAKEKALAQLSTPSGFAKGVLKLRMGAWQEDVVNEFDNLSGRVKVACSAPNGAGKSGHLITTLILRTLATKPQARFILTSADPKQLYGQVWPALYAHRTKFPQWEWHPHARDWQIRTHENGFLLMFTTDDPGRAEGWHSKIDLENKIDSPVIIACDESKSIPEFIFDAFSARCTFNGLFYVSSTGMMQGSFYDAMCGKGGFKRYSLGLADCPWISKKRVDELLEEYKDNLDHPLLRSTLYGEFMDFTGAQGMFVTLTDITNCIASPPIPHPAYVKDPWANTPPIPYDNPSDISAFCDYAGGIAENVLAVRRGNVVTLKKCWKEHNEGAAVSQFVRLFREEELRPGQIWGDNAGSGKVMNSWLAELGWPINPFNGGSEAHRKSDFADRNAEIWEMGGRQIKKCCVVIPDDPKLHEQMVTRKRAADVRGRIKCESKDDMAKRGIASPDRADAFFGALMCQPLQSIEGRGKIQTIIPSWVEYMNENSSEDFETTLPGTDVY